MLRFVKNHWKAIFFGAAILAAAALCIFSPPAMLAIAASTLAASTWFGIFGAYAGVAATALVFTGTSIVAGLTALTAATIFNAIGNCMGAICCRRTRPESWEGSNVVSQRVRNHDGTYEPLKSTSGRAYFDRPLSPTGANGYVAEGRLEPITPMSQQHRPSYGRS